MPATETHACTPTTSRPWLEVRRAAFERRRAYWSTHETLRSWARLGAFVLAIVPWLLLGGHPAIAGGLTLVAMALFIVAVRAHHRALAQRGAAERLLLVLDEALLRCGGQVTCLRAWQRPTDDDVDRALPRLGDAAPDYPLTEQERDDLDLFAPPVGIFGLLNRTSSAPGARCLRDLLERPLISAEHITKRQAAVRWLAEHSDERLRGLAALAALRGEDERLRRLTHALAEAESLHLVPPARLLRLWSLLSCVLAAWLIARVAQGFHGALGPLVVLFVFNGLLLWCNRRPLRAALDPWHDTAWAARGYLIAAREATAALPHETTLNALRQALVAAIQPNVLPRLQRRIGWTERGGVAYAFINLMTLADVHIAGALQRCAVPQRASLLAGLSAIAQLDALCSLASFAAEQPVACWPVPVEPTSVSITAGVHPLVPPERVVPNDLSLSLAARMWVVTGSNMAGKSTFLRMAATNVLLAQAACAAVARDMRWSPLRLVTDLRVRDNLAENESYFLAEVRHLRRMLLPPSGPAGPANRDTDGPGSSAPDAGPPPLLGLIDEPFRGTNSDDQTAASIAVARRLLLSENLFVIATHDRQLTELADGQTVRNYHFRENLAEPGTGSEAAQAATLVFDYRLHEGPAQTRNALRILEREGYPPDLVAAAHAWLSAQQRS